MSDSTKAGGSHWSLLVWRRRKNEVVSSFVKFRHFFKSGEGKGSFYHFDSSAGGYNNHAALATAQALG